MGQPYKRLGGNESFFSRVQIAFDGVIQTGRIVCSRWADDGIIASLNNKNSNSNRLETPNFSKARKR